MLFQSNGHLKEILWVVIFNFEAGTEKLREKLRAKKFVGPFNFVKNMRGVILYVVN